MNIVSIDPGLVTSGTGVAVFIDGIIQKSFWIGPLALHNFKHSSEKIVDAIIKNIDDSVLWGKDTVFVVETNRYMGKSNMLHLKLLGVLDHYFGIETIHAMTVKKLAAGSGKATKDEIKQVLMQKYSHAQLFSRIDWRHEDSVDSVAIGLAYIQSKEV